MKKKAPSVESGGFNRQDCSGSLPDGFYDLNPSAPYFSSASAPNFPYLDLGICREPQVKSLIRSHSKDMYRLLEKVHFDGKYYRVKCVSSGDWEYCWDLAVRIQFFGKMQGIVLYPKRLVSRDEKKIVYRSVILVNPYQLWDQTLVARFWNLQERIEFLIARILFHECIHLMISLGNTLPSDFGNTDIYLEFRRMLEISNSNKLISEFHEVQFRLWNLSLFGAEGSESEQTLLERVQEIYEFLINEKYSNQKTGKVFHSSSNNEKLARKYAWVAGVKAGGDVQVSRNVWKVEIRRLSIALRRLYKGIDTLLR
ncbi:hypothetical protein MSSIT_0213 [Methanosarcina siciliae T4/M]|uniref:Uncharacterized protein n=2 Tax=Methanosarcina siciliae TaxID=38027 RepID=A0A0E3P9Y7_9EURY|nr:YlbF family regulator [Methanosarcina siciliae]AKB26932.1 hypothetical protein MSSIT_0213 [Methanosarcina siciliae T4/M]AKB30899.1 hypothetical protein MSSIH_0209 [Methanosarcina siciliae HI350]